jgi:hypothetical protein
MIFLAYARVINPWSRDESDTASLPSILANERHRAWSYAAAGYGRVRDERGECH